MASRTHSASTRLPAARPWRAASSFAQSSSILWLANSTVPVSVAATWTAWVEIFVHTWPRLDLIQTSQPQILGRGETPTFGHSILSPAAPALKSSSGVPHPSQVPTSPSLPAALLTSLSSS
eukprot:6890412-Pyramimonas_sp.AAC.1